MNLQELKNIKLNELDDTYKDRLGHSRIDFLGEDCFADFYFRNGKLKHIILHLMRIPDKSYPEPEIQERKFQYWIQLINSHFGEGVYSEDRMGRAVVWEIDGYTLVASTIDRGKSPHEGGQLRVIIKENEDETSV